MPDQPKPPADKVVRWIEISVFAFLGALTSVLLVGGCIAFCLAFVFSSAGFHTGDEDGSLNGLLVLAVIAGAGAYFGYRFEAWLDPFRADRQ